MKKKTIISAVLALALATFSAGAQNGPVKAWEGTIDLPTYRVNAPDEREGGFYPPGALYRE